MSRRPSLSRATRLAAGIPYCEVDGCDRAPYRRTRAGKWYCVADYATAPKAPPVPKVGPHTQLNVDVPADLRLRATAAAAERRLTLAEWTRRALVEALERQGAAKSGS